MTDQHSPELAEPVAPSVSLPLQIAWFGLLGGYAELLALAAQDAIRHTITVESIRTNHHHIWMTPLAGLMLVGVVGAVLAIVGRFFPRTVRQITPYALGFVACLMPLLAIRGLYPIAQILLAAGLASRIGPLASLRPGLYRSVLRFSTPVFVLVLVGLIGGKGADVIFAEQRAVAALPASKAGAKNVLLLVMDNVRADHLSLYGYARDTSPKLEQIAKDGVRFDQTRSPAPWTLPSHASMLTGLWPHQLSTSIDTPLDDKPATLAEALSDQGYLTGGFVGNTFYCNSWYGLDRGFSRYEDFPQNREINAYEIFRSAKLGDLLLAKLGVELATPGAKESRKTSAGINQNLLDWVDKRGDRPFFAFVNYYDAHEPFSPPDGYPRRYGLSALDETSRRAISKRYRDLSRGKPQSPDLEPRSDAQIVDEANRLLVDGYDDCIHYLDEQIGNLFDELKSRGLLENTVVVITSDHGEHFGDRGLYGHGNSLYRPLVDVPMIVLAPDLPARGTTVKDLVSPRDVAATVLQLAKSPNQDAMPGQSLARFWTDSQPTVAANDPPLSHVEYQPKLAPAQHIPAARGEVWSIAGGGRVYIRNGSGREELYDLTRDPNEQTDLATKPDEKPALESLRNKLNEILTDHPAGSHTNDGVRPDSD